MIISIIYDSKYNTNSCHALFLMLVSNRGHFVEYHIAIFYIHFQVLLYKFWYLILIKKIHLHQTLQILKIKIFPERFFINLGFFICFKNNLL